MSLFRNIRDTLFRTGRSSSLRTTTSETPYVISSTFQNPSFRLDNEVGQYNNGQDQTRGSSWINDSAVSDPGNPDGSLSDSLLHEEVQHPSSQGAVEMAHLKDSIDSSSFSSTNSRQRIIRQGRPPLDVNVLNIQNNYAARNGSDNGSHQINQSFENQGYDSNGDDLVSRSSSQGSDLAKSTRDFIRQQKRPQFDHDSDTGTIRSESSSRRNYKVVDDGEKPGTSGSTHDLAKSTRDFIRQQRRPQIDHDSDTDAIRGKSSSRRKYKVVDDGEKPGSSRSTHDLAKSTRDFIRHQKRPQVDHDSDTDTIRSESSSRRIGQPDSHETSKKEVDGMDKDTPKPRRGLSWLKFTVLATMIFGAITTIIILIIALRDPTPPGRCTAEIVNLNQSIIIVCNTGYDNDCNVTITPPPTASVNQMVLLTKQLSTNSEWTMAYISNKNITLTGPKAKCSSAGQYKISITDTVKNLTSSLIAKLEISVNPELVTDFNVTKSNVSKEATCKSQTQCQESYRLRILPSTNPKMEFNQTCSTRYSDSAGWTTLCTGQIQNNMSNVSCTITCILSNNIITIPNDINICQ